MGMTYQFRVAKKIDLPEDLTYYSDAEDKFFDVGPDFDREDWLGGFIRDCADDKCSFNHKAITTAIEKLKQLTKNSREKIVLETNLSSKKCDNCGEYIEMSEFEKNPETVYCKHCRMTQFDGPDIYD